ncbi:hypothetical protein Tco_0617993 [Tanacetum coccineum]
MAQRRATTPSIYHSLLPAGTPPLLPIPLHAPSTSCRADIPEADTPPRKRLLLIAPMLRVEIGEDLLLLDSQDLLWPTWSITALASPRGLQQGTRRGTIGLETHRELQSADRRRQTVITEMLAADHRRQKQLTEALKLIKRLQTQMAEFERQQGPAKGPAQPELPEEAGSSS